MLSLMIFLRTLSDLDESPSRPLFDRAIQGQYPPGSTIKPLLALAALQNGWSTSHSVCNGWFATKDNHRYRCWEKRPEV